MHAAGRPDQRCGGGQGRRREDRPVPGRHRGM